MTDVLEAPKAAADRGEGSRLKIADCDIHPAFHAATDLIPFLPKRWADHIKSYGVHLLRPYGGTVPYPRSSPLLSRRDAWPDAGGPPGSDLDFMRKQHLDALDIEFGVMQVLDLFSFGEQNLEFGAALASAVNDWQIERWCKPEPRLKGSIVVGQEDAVSAVAEIERRADDDRFVQVNITPRAMEPLGRRRYWPIFAAAEASGRPIGLHVGGYGGVPPTGSGWPTFYAEEHHSNAHTVQAQLASLVIEGVPERFPKLRFVFIEGGFGWVPAMKWRLDRHFDRFRDEVPHLKRLPSEYIRDSFWFTTQPIEEPEHPEHMRDIIDCIGADRLMFSSDYPHWDFDDPRYAFKIRLTEAEKRLIFLDNALSFYGLS
jgi:predicted TIM-barrel fold metal-dependent hydrolase